MQANIFATGVVWLVRMCIGFSLVYLCALFVNPNCFFVSVSLFLFVFLFSNFGGISFVNPHETSLVHLEEARGLKSLLHMLNATVILMKVS